MNLILCELLILFCACTTPSGQNQTLIPCFSDEAMRLSFFLLHCNMTWHSFRCGIFKCTHPCSHHASFFHGRDITLLRPSLFWTPSAATSLRSSPGRWDKKLTFTRYNCPFPFTTCCYLCMWKLKLFVALFFRTTSGCWIWLETSFWLPTWLTTFAFSKTCRRWLMVCSQ